MKNPFRRRWIVERFTPLRSMQHAVGSPYRWMGPKVEEQPPAPAQRLYWSMSGALRARDRLNEGMAMISSRDRFRIAERQ